jgi:hypothetical protein
VKRILPVGKDRDIIRGNEQSLDSWDKTSAESTVSEGQIIMGLLDRISRLVRANVNDMVSKAEDPEKILEQAVIEMQDNLLAPKSRASAQQR